MLHFIEVTEQKNLEIQFAQSQRCRPSASLPAGWRTISTICWTAMIGFCDLLLMRFRPGDPSFADIMQIKQKRQSRRQSGTPIAGISRQQTLQPRIIDITDVLVELSHLLRRLIGENIELKVVHGRDLGLAKGRSGPARAGDHSTFAVNARDAMQGGGTLTIRTSNISQASAVRRGHEVMPAGDYVLIEVSDTGVGISKEHLARIFEPFFSTKEVGSGTGLGLSTVYGIVKQTGGFIFVDSAPGRGRHVPDLSAAPPAERCRAKHPRRSGGGAAAEGSDRDRHGDAGRGRGPGQDLPCARPAQQGNTRCSRPRAARPPSS